MLLCSKEAFARCPTAHLCGRREDSTFTEGSECDKFNQLVEMEQSAQTNADRIRAMSDKDLAEFINFGAPCNRCVFEGACVNPYDPGRCIAGVMQWLRQPVQLMLTIGDDSKKHSGLLED